MSDQSTATTIRDFPRAHTDRGRWPNPIAPSGRQLYTVWSPSRLDLPIMVMRATTSEFLLSDYTERRGQELRDFILSNIDAEERERYYSELDEVALASLEYTSFLPLARFYGDWEESVSLKLDADLGDQVRQALEEAEATGDLKPSEAA